MKVTSRNKRASTGGQAKHQSLAGAKFQSSETDPVQTENRRIQSLIRAERTPLRASDPSGEPPQNVTEVQVSPAAPSPFPETKLVPGHDAPSSIASEASGASGGLNPACAAGDFAAIVYMSEEQLQHLAHDPGPVSPEIVLALRSLRRQEGEAEQPTNP